MENSVANKHIQKVTWSRTCSFSSLLQSFVSPEKPKRFDKFFLDFQTILLHNNNFDFFHQDLNRKLGTR